MLLARSLQQLGRASTARLSTSVALRQDLLFTPGPLLTSDAVKVDPPGSCLFNHPFVYLLSKTCARCLGPSRGRYIWRVGLLVRTLFPLGAGEGAR